MIYIKRIIQKENTITYYFDMATFFYRTKEYNEAGQNHYDRARELIKDDGDYDKVKYAYTCYREGKCYEKLGNIEETYRVLEEAMDFIDFIEDPLDRLYLS